MSGTSPVHNEDLFNFLIAEANHPFSGWDFSHISKTDRMVDAPLTWSYAHHPFLRRGRHRLLPQSHPLANPQLLRRTILRAALRDTYHDSAKGFRRCTLCQVFYCGRETHLMIYW
jgi:hypothetical protein